MAGLTWLHLSDWHQKGPDFDRDVVRDALLRDIRERERIDPALAQVDFIVFSGDLAFSGDSKEYEAAREHLLEPILATTGLEPERMFFVPGNHDLHRETVYEMLPPELQNPLGSDAMVQKWLSPQKRGRTLEPFEAYRAFVRAFTSQPTPDFGSIVRFDAADIQVALLGLNSAWMNARNRDAQGEIQDYGYTLIGEQQVHDSLQQIADADLRIAVVHHPFDWLSEFDRNRTEAKLGRNCHFILCGHTHNPQVKVLRGTGGDCIIVPAGASYDRRVPVDPRYANAYNWVHLDLVAGRGVVYLRRWSDQRDSWIEDTDAHPGGSFPIDSLPAELGAEGTLIRASSAETSPPEPLSGYQRELKILEGYLDALVRNNAVLDPRGIKTSKIQVVLPLEDIYVGLQAERDRPDVDRRVLQEELDEIKKRLEREEDPDEREKQYQIWANQARVLEQALEVSGPREELSDIVLRHRQVVILGDPGSGKTTLVRYLALRLARVILTEPERLFQAQDLWDEQAVWRLPDLGPVRLPILLRIANYAEARQKDPDLALVDYLPRYFAGLSVPYADELGLLLRKLLEAGRCIVLLDGLDEIIDPADRRNIATAIGQFAGVYRETGLPDWLARSLDLAPVRIEDRPEDNASESDVRITWNKDLPADVRQEWETRIKQRLRELRRGGRALRLAWDLLNDARYAHVGNRFVVTSRIAGYHFANVPGEFEHYTIRRMSRDDIELFLEKWCPAVERLLAKAADPAQVEQRAQREVEGILHSVDTTPGVRRMAENPLLLRILAVIHRNEAHLPQRRVELYETATVTLLRDWHLERGTKGAIIDDVKATSLLGPVAFHIHETYASGFLPKGETEQFLGRILAREQGEDPDQPSLATREAVQQFLETVREHSGLFVERGEGLYGFMHLTFQEYFTARQLVSDPLIALEEIQHRLHQPRWREPVLLAVGSVSKQFYEYTDKLLRAILEANSPYEHVLHRDLLFAAACVGDSVNVAPLLRHEIASRLLSIYCDRHHAGRYLLLQHQVKEALLVLCNDQGDAAVEAALAEQLAHCANRSELACALDAVDWLQARTPAVADALIAFADPGTMPRAEELLRAVQARLPANGNGLRLLPAGWDVFRDDITMTRFLGVMGRYGQTSAVGGPSKPDSRHRNHPLQVGMEVILGRHRPVDGDDNWNERMTTFVDLRARVIELRGRDNQECWLVKVDVDDGEWLWRVRDLQIVLSNGEEIPGETYAYRYIVDEIEAEGLQTLLTTTDFATLAPLFAAVAPRLIPLWPWPGEDALRASLQAIETHLADVVLDSLRRAPDAPHYRDAALYLVASRVRQSRDQAVAVIMADLEGRDAVRCRLALQLLAEPAFREHVQFTDAQRSLLLGWLDAPTDQAAHALDILFAMGLAPDLLARCWELLRRPDHPLAAALRKKLEGVKKVKGDQPTLALLDEGTRDAMLRADSLELLHKVSWQGTATFAQALTWLADKDAEVRQLAALLLASQNDLLAVPRSVLTAFSRERLHAQGADATLETSDATPWSSLRYDASLVRLLGGLWLHGWDDALAQLWIAKPARNYIDRKHPSKYWTGFRTYPESEDCIRWLLEKAQFGQALIPAFRSMAAYLASLEGGATGAPQAEHIAAVQQALTHEMETLVAQPDISVVLRTEAAILAACVRNQSLPSVAELTLRNALESTDNVTWIESLAKLAVRSELRQAVVAVLDQAFASTDPERRMLALSLLSSHPELLVALKDSVPAFYMSQVVKVDEALTALSVLLQLEPPPAGLYIWLHSIISTEDEHPLSVWMRETLAIHDLAPDAAPHALARLLTHEYDDASISASLALFAADLPSLLVPALREAALSQNDRTRVNGLLQFQRFCYSKLPTDGSTMVVDWLQRTSQSAEGSRHEGTVMTFATKLLDYRSTYWPTEWMRAVKHGDDSESHFARRALKMIRNASPVVIRFLCDSASTEQPDRARWASVSALSDIRLHNHELRADAVSQAALILALDDPQVEVRRTAAYALQWTTGQGAWSAAQALLHTAQFDPDSVTRTLALRSVGSALHAVRGFRDVDVSKEALFRWFDANVSESQGTSRAIREAVEQLSDLPVLRAAPDAKTALNELGRPESLGLTDGLAANLSGEQQWDKLLQSAREEWDIRGYWQQTLPYLPAAIAQLEANLAAPEPDLRRAAACSLARLYHGDDERPARLRDLLRDDAAVLQALLDAVTDEDSWGDEGAKMVSHHPWAVKQIVGWLEARPPEERSRLVAGILKDLESAMNGMDDEDVEQYDAALDEPWSPRRALVAVLAELSERLTYRTFISERALSAVVSVFARAATDPGSYSARRFAIRALGNLQQFTPQVADVFFAACQDVGHVYRETLTAVHKFKVFGPGSLERLTAAIRSPSITVAYHAALLLGELGVSRSEDLGADGRRRVADELVQLLESPLSERIVYDFAEDSDGKRVGPLYDVIYEALMRVVAGPDAPMSPVTEPVTEAEEQGSLAETGSPKDILRSILRDV